MQMVTHTSAQQVLTERPQLQGFPQRAVVEYGRGEEVLKNFFRLNRNEKVLGGTQPSQVSPLVLDSQETAAFQGIKKVQGRVYPRPVLSRFVTGIAVEEAVIRHN